MSNSMSPERISQQFARICSLCDMHNITEPTHIFNLDDCAFSVKEIIWGRRDLL